LRKCEEMGGTITGKRNEKIDEKWWRGDNIPVKKHTRTENTRSKIGSRLAPMADLGNEGLRL
jgi:hypothetical protein